MNLLAFLVPWRQTKTHSQFLIGKVELKGYNMDYDTLSTYSGLSQFLIGKVERRYKNEKNFYERQHTSQFLIGKVLLYHVLSDAGRTDVINKSLNSL